MPGPADGHRSEPPQSASLGRLAGLAEELARYGLAARLRAAPGRAPSLHVVNPLAARLAENVYAGRARDGRWWFWWPWRERIARGEDVSGAATVIARVLAVRDGTRPVA